jgi:predicted ATPase/DNA-binding SARP family transcriptional activator
MAADIEVSLLGPLEVRTGDRTVPVVGVKLQALLGLLALAVPHGVSDDRLLEELWGDEPPAKPANALQALVSHLRRVLGRDTVVRRGNGYALLLEPQSVDALVLEQLVQDGLRRASSGDRAGAATSFRRAVDLVRGPPFDELADRWFARDAVARLEQLVVTAHEGIVDGLLASGRHAEALPALSELVADHPARERFRAQLIVALYRSGRQVDALHAYRDARRYLLDELGLDPGPELRQLERAVLSHDPALAAPIDLPSPVGRRDELPAPLTSFVGRTDDLTALDDAVARSRLVTLVGPGGVGKTRLALELARRLADGQEVWYVELAPLTADGGHLADAVAAGVGAPDRTGVSVPPLDRVVERLAQRPALLVLDNCEHVLDDTAMVALRLLRACPGLRVLATSREPIGVEGERQLPLRPLPVDDAVTLFVARARDAHPLFEGDEEALTRLVEHLDGLPLAIELAAARAKTLPVPEIVERLGDRFGLLRRTTRGGTARHDGLEAAIDWSYDLLFADEQRTFERLAVLPAGATAAAVERLCGADGLELASRLVDRSLLVADTSGRGVRFIMLESLRAYGSARLRDAGRLDEVRSQLTAWCIELAEAAEVASRGPDELAWLDLLDAEHDNIRAALAHAVEHDPGAALRLTAALIRPWWFRGRRQDIRQWADTVLAVAGAQHPVLRAKVLSHAGLMAEPRHTGDGSPGTELKDELAAAERDQREAIELQRRHGDARDVAYAELLLLATLTRQASLGETLRPGEAAALVASATATFDTCGDDYGSAVIRTTDAILAISEGDLERATARAEVAAPIVRRLGERFAAGRLEYVLGMLDDLAGNPRSAYRHLEQGLRLMSELGLHQAVTAQARLLAPLAERSGETSLAAQWRAFVADGDAVWTHYDGTVMAAARNHAGVAARHAGDLEDAAQAHRSALDWYADAGLHGGIAVSETCLGMVAVARGDAGAAIDHRARALEAVQLDDDPAALATTLVGAAAAVAGTTPAHAARLLGAAERVRGSGDYAPTEIERDVAAVTAALRKRIGDASFAVETDAGQHLDRRAAIVLAAG